MIDEAILGYIAAERERQVTQWGDQHLPDGTGGEVDIASAVMARALCDSADLQNAVTWRHVLREEVCEAFAESDHGKLKAELVQVAAVATAWIRDIESRSCRDCAVIKSYTYEIGSGSQWPNCGVHGSR